MKLKELFEEQFGELNIQDLTDFQTNLKNLGRSLNKTIKKMGGGQPTPVPPEQTAPPPPANLAPPATTTVPPTVKNAPPPRTVPPKAG